MKRALYLVDGTYELFRCFHGAPRKQDSDGRGRDEALQWTGPVEEKLAPLVERLDVPLVPVKLRDRR